MKKTNKNKFTPNKKDTKQTQKAAPKKSTVIIAASLAAVFVILFVVGLVVFIENSKAFNYMTADLSKYITLSESDYKDYTLTSEFDEPGDSDLQRKINQLIVKNKNKTALYNGANVINLPITLGDVVTIYYRGYTVDENGNEVDVDNASNLFGEAYKLEIGSGSFIPGFEEGLIGIIPKEHPRNIEKIESGKVTVGDVIYLSYEAIYPDGTVGSVSEERIDLSSASVDAKYGKGFKSYFTGGKSPNGAANNAKTIGETIAEQKVFSLTEGGSVVYYNMKVNYVTRETVEPLTIEAHFPSTYFEESLRGKDVKFDVYIASVIIYDTPEYSEEFIRSTLKLTDEALSEYEGSSIVEKHKASLMAELKVDFEADCRAIHEEELWNHLHELVKVKKLPESEVNKFYLSEYNDMYAVYSQYSSAYKSVDDFARVYYGLPSGSNYKLVITEKAERIVTEKLMFYYIMKRENITPVGEAYDALYQEAIDGYMDYYKDIYKSELDACKTDEEYNAKIAELEEKMMSLYGEAFFRESVYYTAVVRQLIEWMS